MKNLALVGGTGFIGQSISKKVHSNILVVSRKTEGQISKNPIILFDNFCHDYSHNQDYIFYLVNQVLPRSSTNNLDLDMMFNYEKKVLSNIIRSMSEKKTFVFFSSGGAVYGPSTGSPFKENSLLQPISMYGKLKKMLESHCEDECKKHNINLFIIRPSNPYGRLQRSMHQGVITKFIRSIMANKDLTIYGDGKGSKDYIHVDDMIDILFRVLKNNQSGTFNIGSGYVYSLIDIITIIEKSVRKKSKIVFQESFEGDVKEFSLNIDRIKPFCQNINLSLEHNIYKLIQS